MSRYIEIGKPMSKICLTCKYWTGGTNFVKFRAVPSFFDVDEKGFATRAVCLKNGTKTKGFGACKNHIFHYEFERYLK